MRCPAVRPSYCPSIYLDAQIKVSIINLLTVIPSLDPFNRSFIYSTWQPSVCQFIRLMSVRLSFIHPSTEPCIHPSSIRPSSVCQPIRLSSCLSIFGKPTCLSSGDTSIHPSIHQSIHLSVHPSGHFHPFFHSIPIRTPVQYCYLWLMHRK